MVFMAATAAWTSAPSSSARTRAWAAWSATTALLAPVWDWMSPSSSSSR